MSFFLQFLDINFVYVFEIIQFSDMSSSACAILEGNARFQALLCVYQGRSRYSHTYRAVRVHGGNFENLCIIIR